MNNKINIKEVLNGYRPQPPKDVWDNIHSQLETEGGKRIDTQVSGYNKHPGSGYWDNINKRLIWNRFITFSSDRFNVYYLIGMLCAISLIGMQAIHTHNKRLYFPQNNTDNILHPLNTPTITHDNPIGTEDNHGYEKSQSPENASQNYHSNPSETNKKSGIQNHNNMPLSLSEKISHPGKTAAHSPENTIINQHKSANNNQKLVSANPEGCRHNTMNTDVDQRSKTCPAKWNGDGAETDKSRSIPGNNIPLLKKIPLSELISKNLKSGDLQHFFPDSLITLLDLPDTGEKSNLSICIDYGSLLHINTWESLENSEIMIQDMPIHQYFNNNVKTKISHKITCNIVYSKDNFVAGTGAGISILQSQFKGRIPVEHTVSGNTGFTYTNVDFDNRIFYLDIPVWIGYREYTPLTEYHMQVGLTESFPLKHYYTWYDTDANTFVYNDGAPFRKKLFSIAAKGFFARRLNEHCLLGIEPAYYYRLSSVFEEDYELNVRQHIFKVGLKFQYNF